MNIKNPEAPAQQGPPGLFMLRGIKMASTHQLSSFRAASSPAASLERRMPQTQELTHVKAGPE